ncbi:MAG: alpha/beta fold hydrolase, partial [Acidimicrobiaceae bacterium]|nr:alpha/beta fold hydrolase [Acidimicrobiaceae bacterium]
AAMPAGGVPAGAPRSGLQWGACHHDNLPPGYQCATLPVPVDGEHAGNAGPSFPLALARLPAHGTAIGSLLVDPGGPGVSGVKELPGIVGMLSPTLLDHFNVVGFDPPGVGESDPVICLSSAAFGHYLNLDPAPTTTAGLNTLLAGNRTFARGCEARSGRILPHVSTVAAARDMDRIRQAVGDPKLNYLGFSYGTLLGATYAHLYPTRVRAMALDGAINPALAPVPMITAQAVALDGQLRRLETACASDNSCPWHASKGQTLAAAFQGLVARVRAHPLHVSGTSETVGPAALLYGTAAGLYSTDTWPSLEEALAKLANGDGGPILAMFDAYVGRNSNGTYANTFEAESAVDCLDAPSPSVRQLVADGRQLERQAPAFGLLDLYSQFACAVWPVKATGTVGPVSAPGSPPIVVIGSTGDPITPYRWAVSLAHQLNHGVLLTRVGDGHTGYPASACVRDALDRYLVDGKAPAAGTRCQSS